MDHCGGITRERLGKEYQLVEMKQMQQSVNKLMNE